MAKHKFKPSALLKIGTIGSNARRGELESIANNVLVILKRTEDVVREITKEEYIEERKKDNNGQNISSDEEQWLDIFLAHYNPLTSDFHPDW